MKKPFELRFAAPFATQLYANTTDNLGTSTHFSFSVVHLIDAVVVGVVDE